MPIRMIVLKQIEDIASNTSHLILYIDQSLVASLPSSSSSSSSSLLLEHVANDSSIASYFNAESKTQYKTKQSIAMPIFITILKSFRQNNWNLLSSNACVVGNEYHKMFYFESDVDNDPDDRDTEVSPTNKMHAPLPLPSSTTTPSSSSVVSSLPPARSPAVIPASPPAPAISSLPMVIPVPPEQKGYIKKQGQSFKSWKNRYFYLNRGILTYFSSESEAVSSGMNIHVGESLPLQGYKISSPQRSRMLLTGPGAARNLLIEVADGSDFSSWQRALEQHIQYSDAVQQQGNKTNSTALDRSTTIPTSNPNSSFSASKDTRPMSALSTDSQNAENPYHLHSRDRQVTSIASGVSSNALVGVDEPAETLQNARPLSMPTMGHSLALRPAAKTVTIGNAPPTAVAEAPEITTQQAKAQEPTTSTNTQTQDQHSKPSPSIQSNSSVVEVGRTNPISAPDVNPSPSDTSSLSKGVTLQSVFPTATDIQISHVPTLPPATISIAEPAVVASKTDIGGSAPNTSSTSISSSSAVKSETIARLDSGTKPMTIIASDDIPPAATQNVPITPAARLTSASQAPPDATVVSSHDDAVGASPNRLPNGSKASQFLSKLQAAQGGKSMPATSSPISGKTTGTSPRSSEISSVSRRPSYKDFLVDAQADVASPLERRPSFKDVMGSPTSAEEVRRPSFSARPTTPTGRASGSSYSASYDSSKVADGDSDAQRVKPSNVKKLAMNGSIAIIGMKPPDAVPVTVEQTSDFGPVGSASVEASTSEGRKPSILESRAIVTGSRQRGNMKKFEADADDESVLPVIEEAKDPGMAPKELSSGSASLRPSNTLSVDVPPTAPSSASSVSAVGLVPGSSGSSSNAPQPAFSPTAGSASEDATPSKPASSSKFSLANLKPRAATSGKISTPNSATQAVDSRNADHFRRLLEEEDKEKRRKEEELAPSDPDTVRRMKEAAALEQEHSAAKTAHYARLGATFKTNTSFRK